MKGVQAITTIAGLVIMVVVLLLSFLLFVSLRDVWAATEDTARCASQVRAHATAVQVTGELKAQKVVCPTKELEPGGDIRRKLADEMVSCWDTWGRGRLQLFGEEGGRYCHVCATLRAEEDIVGFPEYLDTENVKLFGPTYAEYLTESREGDYFADDAAGESVLPADERLGIIFYYAKGQTNMEYAYNAIVGDPVRNTAVGSAAGGAAGALVGVYIVSLVTPAGWISTAGIVATGAVTGATAGGATGFFTGIFGREPLDTLAYVLIRPLGPADVRQLGCTYAPVANT